MARDMINVSGLRQLSRQLRAIDSDLPKALRAALNEAAQDVIDEARPKIPVKSGRARRALKAASTRTESRVRAGGRIAPYYPWLDFGGRTGRKKAHLRPFLKDGRYLYKTYDDLKRSGQFEDTLKKAIERVVERAGLDGR